MSPQKNIIPFIMFVIILSFVCMVSCSKGIHDADSTSNNYQDESAYDFHAYPSAFSLETSIRRLSMADATNTKNVLNFGAKGDGKTDETKVIWSCNDFI
ncbi:hypothetical protein LIER_24076 [Lithospermum erythrorhizon]|uniref:Pectate lyase superfamily protein domain-containing protein n=1 Tax=Lithospermum erythrorhizon TaxID=34254 RepID=A0AAV3R412_LITER